VGLAEVLLDWAIPVCPLQRRSLGNYACDLWRTLGERPRTCVIPLYAAGVIKLVEECGFSTRAYADDLQVYRHASPAQSSELMAQMVNCIAHVEAWMACNRLRLNPAKTEVIWL